MDTSVQEAHVLAHHEVLELNTHLQVHTERHQHTHHIVERAEAHFLEAHDLQAVRPEAHFLVVTISEVSHEIREGVEVVSADEVTHLVAEVANLLHTIIEPRVVADEEDVSKRHLMSQNL